MSVKMTDVDIRCDFKNMLAAVVFPTGQHLLYSIHMFNDRVHPKFEKERSSVFKTVDGHNPELIRLVAETWLKMGAGRDPRAKYPFKFDHQVVTMPNGDRLPAPELEGERRALIAVLITMDTDHDGYVEATLDEINARAQLINHMAGGTTGSVIIKA